MIQYTGGTGGDTDTDGQPLNNDGIQNSWHQRTYDLTPWAGDVLQTQRFGVTTTSGLGDADIWFADMVLVSSDGTVIPIYHRQDSIPLTPYETSSGMSNVSISADTTTVPANTNANIAATYYLGDQVGTTQMETAGNGVPVWQGEFSPFGQELDNQTTENNYKFTGKERDTESGLDYFGARYYASNMGRFMSPDWSAKIEPVPYSKLDNPQSFNLYAYVGNNPLSNADTDGHACISLVNASSGFCTRADTYKTFDDRVYGRTRFFAAASAATQELADVAVPGFGSAGTSASTRAFLESTGENLLKTNQQAIAQVESGAITGSGAELDAKLVNIEQSAVQQSLSTFQSNDPAAYGAAISQLNGLLNGNSTMAANALGAVGGALLSTDGAYGQVLTGVRQSLGHDINFANQSDREAIGNALVQHVRQTGGCDVAGSRAHGC